ncbi:hypothetical protein HZS_600 [Henneguya salminicola]|nr:hypothetical protein HZS_600 [Henneguya salminicola]
MALNHIMTAANKGSQIYITVGFLLALYVLGFMHEKGIGAYSIIIEHKLLKTYVSQAVKDYNQGYRLRAFYKLLLFSEMGSTYSLLNAAHIAETGFFFI